ncbi:MAG TPA: TonB-dependent receptor [Arachidicoccus sp.]|nr:TonB-dependent receptor [Arachidicoccus sp.]
MKRENKSTSFTKVSRLFPFILMAFLLQLTFGVSAQSISTNGNVTNKNKEALLGVTIVIKGTSMGGTTDENGHFSINVPRNATMTFSYVGYESIDIPVNGRTKIDVVMEETVSSMDQVIVVGYGTMKKRDLTGSVTTVDRKEILSNPASNAIASIQGKVAGMDISSTSQQPGSAPTVRIRGNRSIKASNDPLYVIDGIPFVGDLSDINSSDIESIDVLKDASATAIYGSRGANGVVLVTTRRGKTGNSVISLNSYYGLQTNNQLDLMSPAQFVEARRNAQRSVGKYDSDVPNLELDKNMFYYPDKYVIESISAAYDENGNYDPSKIKSYDWVDAISRTGIIQDHQLSVQGGNDKTKVSFSAGYFDNKGGIEGFDYSKYTLRLTIDHQVNKWLKLGGSMASTFNVTNSTSGTFYYAAITNPLNPFRDENGILQLTPGGELMPNAILTAKNDITENKQNHFFGSYYAEVKLPAGLKYRINFGPDYRSARNGVFHGSLGSLLGGEPTAANTTTQQYHYTLDNLLYYDKTIKDIHRLGVTLLSSIEDYNFESLNGEVSGLPYEYQKWYNIGTATSVTGLGSGYSKWRLNSYMGRVNYGYKDKYLLTVSGRVDGSSRLAEGNKYAFFPSAAFAWRVIDESFMKKAQWLNNLKLRVGFGETGNTSIDPYETLGSLSRTVYSSGGDGFLGYAPNLLINPDLRWEMTAQYNIGLDFSLFKDRISGTVDLYQQKTTGLILPRQLPIASGFSNITQNIGSTKNSGIEIALSGLIIKSPSGFEWNTSVVYYANKEEITSLYNGKVDDIGNKWFIGQPIKTFYDYKFDGIWQNTENDLALIKKYNANGSSYAPGEIRLYDKNDDGKITADDRTILGSNVPKWSGSLNSTMAYKGFDFSFYLYTRQGQMVYDDMSMMYEGRYNWLDVNYWTPENQSNSFPRIVAGRQVPLNSAAISYQDGTFVKLKTVTLGYSLSQKLLTKLSLSKLRIYGTVQNPYMNKKVWSIDPEGLGFSGPSVKTFMFGLSASF